MEINQILRKFYDSKKLRFSELKGELSSNRFSYYIRQLLNGGLIEKEEGFYKLTDKGEEFICYLDKYDDFNRIKQPIHDVLLLPFKNEKYLFQKRTKRPFLGSCIPIGGKIKSGESIFETAKRKLKEDTGLSGELKLKGIVDVKSIKERKVHLHHVLNVFLITDLKGELINETPKGKNFWMTEKEYYKQKNILSAAKEHFEIVKSKSFMFLELEQELGKDGKFTKARVIRKINVKS